MPDLLHSADRTPITAAIARLIQWVGFDRRRAECARDQLHDDRLGDRRLAGLARLVV